MLGALARLIGEGMHGDRLGRLVGGEGNLDDWQAGIVDVFPGGRFDGGDIDRRGSASAAAGDGEGDVIALGHRGLGGGAGDRVVEIGRRSVGQVGAGVGGVVAGLAVGEALEHVEPEILAGVDGHIGQGVHRHGPGQVIGPEADRQGRQCLEIAAGGCGGAGGGDIDGRGGTGAAAGDGEADRSALGHRGQDAGIAGHRVAEHSTGGIGDMAAGECGIVARQAVGVGLEQVEPEILQPLVGAVLIGRHGDGLGGLAGCEGQRLGRQMLVVDAAGGGGVGGADIDHRFRAGAVAGDGEGDVGAFAGRSAGGCVAGDAVAEIGHQGVGDIAAGEGSIVAVLAVGVALEQVEPEILGAFGGAVLVGRDGHGLDRLVGGEDERLCRQALEVAAVLGGRSGGAEIDGRGGAGAAAGNGEGDRAALAGRGEDAGAAGHDVVESNHRGVGDVAAGIGGIVPALAVGIAFVQIQPEAFGALGGAVLVGGDGHRLAGFIGREIHRQDRQRCKIHPRPGGGIRRADIDGGGGPGAAAGDGEGDGGAFAGGRGEACVAADGIAEIRHHGIRDGAAGKGGIGAGLAVGVSLVEVEPEILIALRAGVGIGRHRDRLGGLMGGKIDRQLGHWREVGAAPGGGIRGADIDGRGSAGAAAGDGEADLAALAGRCRRRGAAGHAVVEAGRRRVGDAALAGGGGGAVGDVAVQVEPEMLGFLAAGIRQGLDRHLFAGLVGGKFQRELVQPGIIQAAGAAIRRAQIDGRGGAAAAARHREDDAATLGHRCRIAAVGDGIIVVRGWPVLEEAGAMGGEGRRPLLQEQVEPEVFRCLQPPVLVGLHRDGGDALIGLERHRLERQGGIVGIARRALAGCDIDGGLRAGAAAMD